MSALDELIYDRTQTDVTYAAELNRKLGRGETLTAQELADWNAGLKGAYNAADMNRVDAAVRELGGMLTAAGYPVEYVDPRKLTSSGVTEIALTSESFQQGVWLYATGEHSDMENYICTNAMIPIVPDVAITARVDIDILSDSGFVWYDADMAYIGGTNNGAPILWGNCFQAIPPANAAYCNIDINASAVTPADIGTVYVRQVANPESAELPKGYAQVEYIESDGTQYIDTGYKANQDTRVVFDAYILQTTTTATGLFGCRQAMGSNGFYIYEQDSASGEYNDGYGSLYTTDISLSASARHIIDKNKNKTYIDETIAHTYAAQTFTVPVTLTLFAIHQSNGVDERMSVCRLYSCVIYDNGTIVRYYIPCTNSAGIVGLYDTVSGAFFRDANSSGAEPVDLPDGYTQVEYIQSNGTQYIDTGVRPSHNSTIAIDAEALASSQDYWGMFGARNGMSMQFWVFYERTKSSWHGRYSSNPNITISGAYAGRHRISLEKNVLKVDNNSSSTGTSSFSSNFTSYIFACNNSGSAQYMCNIKLYSAKVFSGTQLVCDFVPCKNNSGVVGLYNAVNEQFYTNAGSGVFTGGANVSKGFAHGDVIPRPPARDYWIVGDIIDQETWTQYIANVQSLRDAYYTMPDTPELPMLTAPLTFDGANAIEKLLYDISQLYDAMVTSYRLCGAFRCGNNAQHLPLQRSVI